MTPARSREYRPRPPHRPARCPHRRQSRGACADCGHVFADPLPAVAPMTWRERRALEREIFADVYAAQTEIIAGLTALVFVLLSSDRDRYAMPGGPTPELTRAGEALWAILAAMGESAPVQAMTDAIRESRQGERVAMGALQRCMDEVVAFDVRCAAGDEAGAVAALRGWLARVGGQSG